MSSLISKRRLLIGGASFFSLVAGAAVTWQQFRQPVCAPGYELNDPVAIAREHRGAVSAELAKTLHEQFGAQACFSHGLDHLMEVRERNEDFQEAVSTDQILVNQLLAGQSLPTIIPARERLRDNQSKVAHASGVWTAYGKGPLVGDRAFSGGFGPLGINSANGLTADLEYDADNKRMFAAVSAGGVWVSDAVGGDPATLGDSWADIGFNLPTQSTAHVSWSSAEGGTLLVLTGEHTLDGGAYQSLGVFWSSDLGKHWTQAKGMDAEFGTSAFSMAVDQSNPNIIYAATGRGLYRSDDAGRSFADVVLPTGDCAGITDITTKCYLANVVTDVVVATPGGFAGDAVTCGADGCPVLAAVGWPSGGTAKNAKFGDGTPHSANNGIYKSPSGKPGTFVKPLLPLSPNSVSPIGFAPQDQIGRVELGAAYGPQQDHHFVYAIVSDAKLTGGGLPVIDVDDPAGINGACVGTITTDPSGLLCPTAQAVTHATAFNGIYVSPDFGDSWVRLADEVETTYNPTAGSALTPAYVALAGYGPGIQAAYNMWIQVDPTGADVLPAPAAGLPAGVPVPTRVAFGLEEVWASRIPTPLGGKPGTQPGPASDFEVIGDYFAGSACYGLSLNPPLCPQQPTALMPHTTTHPDQHDGLFVPDGKGGVYLFAADDGGIYKQHSSGPEDPFNNTKWSDSLTAGMNTLMIYGFGVSKDGTVYIGLQDNGSAKIEPSDDGDGGRIVSIGGGDGVYSQTDPNDSQFAIQQTPGLALSATYDGGTSLTGVRPGAAAGTAHFTSPFMIDPADSTHIVAVGSKVAVVTEDTGLSVTTWQSVFDLGADDATKLPHQARLRALDVQNGAIYTGWCGPCTLLAVPGGQFQRGLATNVTAAGAPKTKGTDEGWHQATMKGLPRRYVASVEIDPKDAKTVYVGLGNYSTARYLHPGSFGDTNTDIGLPGSHLYKSTDAGETFKDISGGKLPDAFVTSILVVGDQIIAGTDYGAYISSDLNGKDWALMGSMPSVIINQLAQDPSNPKRVFAATYGRGVYTYDLSGKSAAAAGSGKQGKGLLLGALPPWMLLGLLFGALKRITRSRPRHG